MEIPDVIAVNKKDHPAAKTMLNEVRSILSLDQERDWRPPIVTEARRGGVDKLWDQIAEHRAHLEANDLLDERRRQNLAGEVFAIASARAKTHLSGRSPTIPAEAAAGRGPTPRARPVDGGAGDT